MPVDRRQDCRFAPDKEQVQRNARKNLRIVIGYQRYLLNVKGGIDKLNKAKELLKKTEPFLDWELKKIDEIYEALMKGMGLPSVNVHWDKKKKGLRF